MSVARRMLRAYQNSASESTVRFPQADFAKREASAKPPQNFNLASPDHFENALKMYCRKAEIDFLHRMASCPLPPGLLCLHRLARLSFESEQ